MSVLTVTERYVLDCVGCIIRRGAIPTNEVLQAKAVIDTKIKSSAWKFATLPLDDIFWRWAERDIIYQPAREACGPQVRLDHAFGIRGEPSPKNLHGGPNFSQHSCFYHDTRGHLGLTGQLVVGISLIGQTAATGGFCYMPGSHKAFNTIEGKDSASLLLGHESIVVPTLNPGDAVIFFEAMTHGDSGSLQPNKRLVAYYKYTPGFTCWRDPAQQEKYRIQAIQTHKSERIKRLLAAPWAAQYDENLDNSCGIQNTKRPVTP